MDLGLLLWHIFAGRLEAMLLEAKGSWAEAEKAYSSLLEDNPFDQVSSLNMIIRIKRKKY